MTSATERARLGLVVAACAFLSPRAASAQTSAADVSLARQLGNEGLTLAASGDCAGAVEKLERAEGLHHAPTTLTVLGECHVSLGKLVDGVEELTRVVREDLGPRPLPAFRKAQARARKKLDEARPRLPKLRITVEGPPAGTPIDLRIDGQAVPSATLGLDRPIDPGAHDVAVSANGYKESNAHFSMKEGVSQSWKVVLEPAPVAAVTPAPPVPDKPIAPVAREPAPEPPPPAPPATKANYWPAGLLLGAGVAGVAAGAVLGVMTMNTASRLQSLCHPANDCPAGEQNDISSAQAMGWGSTIGIGVGALALGLGTYFLARPPRSIVKEGGGEAAQAGVELLFGPGWGGVRGSF
jgi:hypothetical protein